MASTSLTGVGIALRGGRLLEGSVRAALEAVAAVDEQLGSGLDFERADDRLRRGESGQGEDGHLLPGDVGGFRGERVRLGCDLLGVAARPVTITTGKSRHRPSRHKPLPGTTNRLRPNDTRH
jgi:hypothetical protein